MQVGYHHYRKRRLSHQQATRSQKKLDRFMDDVIYIFGTVGAFIFIPQLLSVWGKGDISGVSIYSWLGMGTASTFWVVYGLIHRAKPIIYANLLAGIIQILIVIGILVH